jgi:hypothetical protein
LASVAIGDTQERSCEPQNDGLSIESYPAVSVLSLWGCLKIAFFFPTVQFFAGIFMIYHGIGISSGNLTWEIPTLNLFNGRIWDSGSYSISRWIFNIVYFFQWEIPTFSITFLEGNPHLANLRTVGSRIVDLSKVLFISSAVVPWLWLWLWVI